LIRRKMDLTRHTERCPKVNKHDEWHDCDRDMNKAVKFSGECDAYT